MSGPVLVGDIGGTHTRLAIAEWRDARWHLGRLHTTTTVADYDAAIRGYLSEAGSPTLAAAAFCGAGPVAGDGSIRLTNAEVALSPGALARAAGVRGAILVNDFAAIAHAVARIPVAAFENCGGGAAERGAPGVVIGPGTGLGIAVFSRGPGGWTVISGEGGHADLAPVDDEQVAAWQSLRMAHGRVSAETALSGPGLERLYAALGGGRKQSAEQIAAAAWRGESGALRVVQVFTRWLGSVAGNLALTAGARGGVYLAGGIIPAWGNHFDATLFRLAFEKKGAWTNWLRGIPSFVVTQQEPGLHGLAALAGESEEA